MIRHLSRSKCIFQFFDADLEQGGDFLAIEYLLGVAAGSALTVQRTQEFFQCLLLPVATCCCQLLPIAASCCQMLPVATQRYLKPFGERPDSLTSYCIYVQYLYGRHVLYC